MATDKEQQLSPTRGWIAAGFGVLLLTWSLAMRGSTWQGSIALHTLMEVVATLLALMVGILGLIRYYIKKLHIFLFIGSGFLGTALLDCYHAVVTSTWFMENFPSPLPSLIPWSWFASRIYLAFSLWLSWYFWRREEFHGDRRRLNEWQVYLLSALFTVATFVFFAFVQLPRAYYPNSFFHRPQEQVAALFFLLALVGYWRKGEWRHDIFEFWLLLSLIDGFLSQSAFMSFAGRNFDGMFDVAHLLKKVSYIMVLTGLLCSLYQLLRQAEGNVQRIDRARLALQHENSQRRLAEESLRTVMAEIGAAVQVLAATAGELVTFISRFAAAIAETATAANQTAAGVEELASVARLGNQKALEVAQSAEMAARSVQDGQQSVAATIALMAAIRNRTESVAAGVEGLAGQGEAIGEIITMVDDLADQTEVLAINAAIEAAKADEHGQGFTVVAQEVKSLAAQSKAATARVRKILVAVEKAGQAAIRTTQEGRQAVSDGAEQSRQTGEVIGQLEEAVRLSTRTAAEIAAACRQQQSSADQMVQAINGIREASSDNETAMGEVKKSIGDIHALGKKLEQLVEQYPLRPAEETTTPPLTT